MNPLEATVYVVDDDTDVRESLDSLIRSVGMRTETFSTAAEFLKHPLPLTPACLVLDVRLPGKSGLDLQRDLLSDERRVPIIFITGHGDIPMSVRAMKDGAVEFLTKPFDAFALLKAINLAVERDRSFLSRREELTKLQLRFKRLSPREKEVFGFVVQGRLNKQIAAELGTTEITVKIQRGNMMKKMKVSSVAELVRISTLLQGGASEGGNMREIVVKRH